MVLKYPDPETLGFCFFVTMMTAFLAQIVNSLSRLPAQTGRVWAAAELSKPSSVFPWGLWPANTGHAPLPVSCGLPPYVPPPLYFLDPPFCAKSVPTLYCLGVPLQSSCHQSWYGAAPSEQGRGRAILGYTGAKYRAEGWFRAGEEGGAMGRQACEHCSGRRPPLLFPAVIQVHPHPSLNTETLTLREDVKGFTSIPDADFPITLGNLSITLARAQLAQGTGRTPSEHTRCVGSAQRQTDDCPSGTTASGPCG